MSRDENAYCKADQESSEIICPEIQFNPYFLSVSGDNSYNTYINCYSKFPCDTCMSDEKLPNSGKKVLDIWKDTTADTSIFDKYVQTLKGPQMSNDYAYWLALSKAPILGGAILALFKKDKSKLLASKPQDPIQDAINNANGQMNELLQQWRNKVTDDILKLVENQETLVTELFGPSDGSRKGMIETIYDDLSIQIKYIRYKEIIDFVTLALAIIIVIIFIR